MVDHLSRSRRSANMARILGKDTAPELTVRRMLHAGGYRYRLHNTKLPGRPDIVFRRRSKVIFVHGCFWHQHASASCRHNRRPKSNQPYWDAKLARTIERDHRSVQTLKESGWEVLILWECELAQPRQAYSKLVHFLGPPKQG
jgi:DNA mismatch endonuclease (patch repair protein)